MTTSASVASVASVLDYTGLAALLAVVGSGAWRLWSSWSSRDERRRKELDKREHEFDEARDAQLARQSTQIETLDLRMRMLERGYHALAGVTHAVVDELLLIKPDATSFALIERSLRMHFPVPSEMPPELTSLLQRIGAASRQ